MSKIRTENVFFKVFGRSFFIVTLVRLTMICRDDVISNAMQRIICTFCRRPFFQGWDRGTTDYTPNSLRGPTYIPLHRLYRQIRFSLQGPRSLFLSASFLFRILMGGKSSTL